jgi:hypothetical protein
MAAGGLIPLSPTAPQAEYGNYHFEGRTYDLLWVSSHQGGPLGLDDYLKARGWVNSGADPNAIRECSAVFTYGSHGAWSHVVVGISNGVVDAHNMARYHASGGFYNIIAIYNAPSAVNTTQTDSAPRRATETRPPVKYPWRDDGPTG